MDILDLDLYMDVTAADLSDVEPFEDFDFSDMLGEDVEERACVECGDLITVAELKNGHCEYCVEDTPAEVVAPRVTAVILPVVTPVVQEFTPAQMRAALRAAGHAVGTRGLLSEAQKTTARALLSV